LSNPIEEQRLIIDQLYRIVEGSCPSQATSARCRFKYDHGYADGSSSVGQAFYYTTNGESVSAALDRTLRAPVMDLVIQLHAAMKAHTGGDWNAFTLFINEDGSITTKFEYPDTPKGTG
jgi:hypothetical protein